ncbi:L,D-transpeptidase catalytic domain [bacterium A37T11]|nr:L,D-transpeptidase catalytic domain [bacterium A37T11]
MKITLTFLSAAAAATFFLTACNQGRKPNEAAGNGKKLVVHEEIKPFEGRYDTLALKGAAKDSGLAFFSKRYSREQRQVILALNRIDSNNVKRADTLVVPDSVWTDVTVYSPFPSRVKVLDSVKKIICFAYPIQAFGVYEDGYLVRWGPTSMGRKDAQTPTGLYFANWKAEEHESSVDDEWLLKWNVNVINDQGVGWHLYAMPGYPASHSCMRLLEKDARWLYDWVDEWTIKGDHQIEAQGTPTLIFGSYDFKGRKPWLKLLNDPNANRISEETLTKELEPHLSKIMEEQARTEKVTEAEKVDSASSN